MEIEGLLNDRKRPWQGVLLGVFCLVIAILSFLLAFVFLMMALGAENFIIYFMKIFRVAILVGDIFIPAFVVFLLWGVFFLFIYSGVSKGRRWAPIVVIILSVLEIILLLFVLLQILWLLVVLNLIIIYLGLACLRKPFYKIEEVNI